MSYRSFHFLVSGRVQGVYFRAFSKGIAHDTGVVGWIRNDERGNVEGVAQGSESALDRFKKALWTGPPHAKVANVEILNEGILDGLEYDVFESIGDILHRALVYSLAGLSVWGIVMMGVVHRETLQRGKGNVGDLLTVHATNRLWQRKKQRSLRKTRQSTVNMTYQEQANEQALAEAAQAALQRSGKSW
ncbi:hypothetical protein IEO21_03886 [Rhodonia placenta]|uniref:acylphosphatase n=1 Tax=Rhodonia placenta TaxID=104341 RepID=A0A8H7U335_9APHY|nr:hypothetical protein IEO21_03886 [Postia placenta]